MKGILYNIVVGSSFTVQVSSNYANLYYRIQCYQILYFTDFVIPLYVQNLEQSATDAQRQEGMFRVILSDFNILVHEFHNN